MQPKISVLMPVRNEERFLGAAIASIQRQALTDWELVAVDDGSTDSTPDILFTAARHDTRIRVVSSSGNGLVSALNRGLAECRSDLVARMDGDDVSHPCRLERQETFLRRHPEIGLLACNVRHFPHTHLRIGMRAYEEWQNSLLSHEQIIRDIYVESPFAHPSVVVRRHLIDSLGGYREMGWAEDYDLWLRLAAKGVIFASLKDTLFFWRDHPARATRTLQEYAAESFRRCKAFHLQNGFLKGAESVTLIGAGIEGRQWRKTLAGIGVSVSRWVDLDPRKVGKILHGAPVIPEYAVEPETGPMLVTIGTRGARAQVRSWASGRGLRELVDFVCVT